MEVQAYTGSKRLAGLLTPPFVNALATSNAPLVYPDAGSGTNAAELLAIGGKAANVFQVAEFAKLKGKTQTKAGNHSTSIVVESRKKN